MADDSNISSDLEDALGRHRSGDTTTGNLVLSDEKAYVGDEITLLGRNLPAEEEFELVWHSTQGRWGVLEANEVIGPQFRPRTETIERIRTDADGQFDVDWEIPEDFGGDHRIEVKRPNQGAVGVASIEVVPHFVIDRNDAPLGEAFTVTGYGLGPSVHQNNYQVAWDNGTVGYMTSVMNRGTATAQVRAVGPPGEHVVQVWRNYRGIPYLQNNTQSPYGPVADGRQSVWTVEVTEPEEEPRTAWSDPVFDETPISTHYPEIDEDTEAELTVTPTSGQAGTTVFIRGEEFPPDTEVDLVWYRHVGEQIQGGPVHPEPDYSVLPTATSDEDGSFQVEVDIPPSEGSTRPIVAEVEGRSVAITGFMVQPSIKTFSPTEGPVGTEIEIELTGIGWPAYENSPFFVYDNKPLGYACGMTDEDKTDVVRTVLRASGEPGYHFIDVYPSIFEMQDDGLEIEVKPHLSYIDNHPVRPLPALHMTFEITE